MELSSGEFNLKEALEAAVSQVMILCRERQVQIVHDSPSEVSSMHLYGDNLRLQQVLSQFLTNAILFTPAFEGSSLSFRVIPRKERIGIKMHIVHLEFRFVYFIPNIAITELSCFMLLKYVLPSVFYCEYSSDKGNRSIRMMQRVLSSFSCCHQFKFVFFT